MEENIMEENTMEANTMEVVLEKSVEEKKKNKMSNKKQMITIGIGVVMILMGMIIATRRSEVDLSADKYTSGYHNATDYTFGADFYTEIYETNNIIVDELNSIDNNLADGLTALVQAGTMMNKLINTIYLCSGVIIIALGMGTIAYGINAKEKE